MAAALRLSGALAISGYALLLLAFALSRVPGTGGDVPIYLLSAHWFSPWTDASPAAEWVARQSLFPPLYPMLLGLVAGADVERARAFTVGCLVLAVCLAQRWVRATGASRAEALLVACTFAALPASWLASLEQLSEPLYLSLSLAALGFAASRRERSLAQLHLAAVSCGLAALTRSIGWTLVVAYSLWLWRQRASAGRGGLAALAFALGLPLAWSVFRAATGIGSSYAEIFESRLAMLGTSPATAVVELLRAESVAIATATSRLFALHPSALERAMGGLVGVLALVGLVRRLRRFELDALYLALYLAVLLVWPFPAHAERFLHAVAPILLWQGLAGVARIACALAPRFETRARAALLVLCLASALPALGYLGTRHREGLARDYAEFSFSPRWYTRRSLREAERDAQLRRDEVLAMRRVREIAPRGACVFAVKPFELALHADRVGRLPPPEDIATAELEAALAECEFVFAEPLVIFPYRTPFHPIGLLGDRFEALESVRASDALGEAARVPAAVIGRIRR
jgi:hypothetical protein